MGNEFSTECGVMRRYRCSWYLVWGKGVWYRVWSNEKVLV